MSTKTSALKRNPVAAPSGTWQARPATITALVPGNIEQAADLGAGYVIVKLRSDAAPEQDSARPKLSRLPAAGEIPAMTRERLVTALHRGGKLAGVTDLRKRPVENEAFMRGMLDQEQARRIQLVESGQLISAQELSHRLEVSPQAISKALKAGRVFALDGGGGRLLYPAFYADTGLSRRDLHKVTQALGDIPPSSKWQFFTNPKASLNGSTPLEALRQGERQAVMVCAAGFLER
jgi:hypothetical protein